MTVDSLTDCLNDFIHLNGNHKTGCLVLHREVSRHPVFKVHHIFTYRLWWVEKDTRELLMEFEESFNMSECSEEEADRRLERAFCMRLFQWMGTKEFKERFNEQIPD